MREINKPFSHTLPVQCPPPYEMTNKYADIYPQLPMITQEGNYQIEDDEERIIEAGKATTTITMYPTSRSKTGKVQTGRKSGSKKTTDKRGYDQTDTEGAIGGYDPKIKRMLEKAETRGKIRSKKAIMEQDEPSGTESGSRDEDSDRRCSPLFEHYNPLSSEDQELRGEIRTIRAEMEQCRRDLNRAISLENQQCVEDKLQSLYITKKELQKRRTLHSSPRRYELRTRGVKKMAQVLVRGQNLEYKPWQNTDMTIIIVKLPNLQSGAHPWISKSEEAWVGLQPAIGDMKRLLANLLGVPAVE